MSREHLQRLLTPRHIAFIGGRALEGAISNCEALGFTGEIWVVNPRYDELAGHPCFPRVADLPDAPDAAFVGVGYERTIEVVGALADRGAGGCVCLAAGFAEVGEAGRTRQEQLAAAAGDMAVIGPNCYGLLNYVDGVALWPDLHGGARVSEGAALIAQSGNLTLNATMSDRSLMLSHVLSIGNQAVTGFGAYLDVLVDDPRVRAVGLYVEGVTDPDATERALQRAGDRGLPVVVLRSGSSPVAARITGSHTGSSTKADDEHLRLFERPGVVEVGSLSALLETLKLFTVWEGGAGPRLAAVAASGGDLAVLADLAAPTALRFPPFDADRSARLAEQLGELVTVGNPLDYHTGIWGRYHELVSCFTDVMTEEVDAAVLVIDLPRAGAGDRADWDTTVDAFIEAHQSTGRRAAVVSTMPEGLPGDVRDRLLVAGVAPLQGLPDAVTALAGAARYHGRDTH